MKKLMIATCGLVFASCVAYGQVATDPTLQANASAPAVEQELSEPDGVAIAIKEDGSFQIFARGSGEYHFNKPQFKRQATQQATMRAKANLSKFMKEKIASSEAMDEVTKTAVAMNSDGQAQTENVNAEALTTATESLRNSSEAILAGVITLKSQLIPEGAGGSVQVTVGVSSKTLKAAKKLTDGIDSVVNGPNGAPSNPVARPSVPVPPPPAQKPVTLVNQTDF